MKLLSKLFGETQKYMVITVIHDPEHNYIGCLRTHKYFPN